jgi:UDP:flavonoid glycosyltransferase YjiC (YdhE family)
MRASWTRCSRQSLMYGAGAGKPALCPPNGHDQNDNAARVQALGLGRTLPPHAPPAAFSSAIMDMLGDQALRAASRSCASSVSRFGELTHAADLIEQAVLGSTQGIGENAACAPAASAIQRLPMSF